MSNFIFRLVRTLRRTTFSILACTAVAAMSADAQTAEIPRTQDGRPDMNGIWQALGNAHWDIEPHAARAALQMQPGPVVPVPAMPVLAFGAVGSVPSGVGVVVGMAANFTTGAFFTGVLGPLSFLASSES